MKKLILACCAIVVIGGCLMLGGWAAGGQLYGSYYNGALHPVSESIRDIAYGLQNEWQYHAWVDEHGWHSGWFDDSLDDWIDDTVNHAVDDALDSIDTGWVDDWLDTRHETISSGIDIPRSMDAISSLNFDFSGVSDNNGTINIVSDTASFDVSGADITNSTIDGATWSLCLTPSGSEQCVIHVPYTISYSNIFLNVGDQTVDITGSGPFAADNLEIHIADGTLNAEMLSSDKYNISVQNGKLYVDQLKIGQMSTNGTLDISLGDGSMTATLVGEYPDSSALSYQLDSDGGAILLNGQAISGNTSEAYHASQKGSSNACPLLRAQVGSGTLDLFLEDTGRAPIGF